MVLRWLMLALMFLPVAAQAAETVNVSPKMVELIQQRIPELRIDGMRPSPIVGLYEVESHGQIYYVDRTGKFLIVGGQIMDTERRVNLTAQRLMEINRIDWASLPLEKAIVSGDPTGAEVAIFTDPDCPYCKQLEAMLKQTDGLKVYTFLYPLVGLHPTARAKAESIWCAKDRHKAMMEVMLEGRQLPAATCQTPVGDVIALAESLQIFGTPTLIARNGFKMAGVRSPADLKRWVTENQK